MIALICKLLIYYFYDNMIKAFIFLFVCTNSRDTKIYLVILLTNKDKLALTFSCLFVINYQSLDIYVSMFLPCNVLEGCLNIWLSD